MRRWLFGITLTMLLSMRPAAAVGTVSVTATNLGARVVTYTIAWTANGSGAVSGNAFALTTGSTIQQVKFIPGSGGSQPSNLYDVTLVDGDSVDVLGGSGGDLSQTAGAMLTDLGIYVDRPSATLDLVVANAGAAKAGTVVVLVVLP